VFKDNELVGGVGGGYGFLVHEQACPEIVNNLFKECAKAGIHLSDGANAVVRSNRLFACAQVRQIVVVCFAFCCSVLKCVYVWL